MFNIAQIQTEIAVAEKLVPLIEAVIRGIGPTVEMLGADAGTILNDTAKLVADLKAKVEELKGVAYPADPPAPPAA